MKSRLVKFSGDELDYMIRHIYIESGEREKGKIRSLATTTVVGSWFSILIKLLTTVYDVKVKRDDLFASKPLHSTYVVCHPLDF